MAEHQKLGGARQSSPLDDEMTYPLTNDEYLTIRENLSFDKFTNWEAFLISTFITTLISGVVIYYGESIYKTEIIQNVKIQKVNIRQVITLIIYGAIALGTILCFMISYFGKKKTKSVIERLDIKITNHLKNV